MTDDTIDYCRQIMINHILIIIICLFLVVYVVINYNLISNGNIYAGNLPKTFIVTGIIFLIIYVFLVWDDNEDSVLNQEQQIEENFQHDDGVVFIPKYKIANKINVKENSTDKNKIQNVNPQNLKPQETKITNKFNAKYIKENSSNGQENSNIFVSNKNRSKFGLKF
jgi:hypothetical protein